MLLLKNTKSFRDTIEIEPSFLISLANGTKSIGTIFPTSFYLLGKTDSTVFEDLYSLFEKNGAYVIQREIYNDFALKKGWVYRKNGFKQIGQNGFISHQKGETIPLENLNGQKLTQWKKHLKKVVPDRKTALKILVIFFGWFATKSKLSPKLVSFRETISIELARKIIPDVTHAELADLLSQANSNVLGED